MRAFTALIIGGVALFGSAAHADIRVSDTAQPEVFRLADAQGTAEIVVASGEAELVGIAARDLAEDIGRITGIVGTVVTPETARASEQVWVGTVGHSPAIDALIANRRIDASALKNCWECSLTVRVASPAKGVKSALIIAGSDRRGTAFGVYGLSRAMGVSPWVWWADVTPLKKAALYVSVGRGHFDQPSVKYRGIFINDEDWGLFPWAARTFDPQTGNLGPKTYEQVLRLLLRLKANTLWPAMHKVSKPFNADPENARLADRFGIVMGSSHAEPMLRNNVGEWTEAADRFNYAANPDGVRAYWQERLKTNGGFENLYTLGMRGIHDSGIVGADTPEAKRVLLNRIIADQRQLLKAHARDGEASPQVFVPYKEVLELYRAGLELPEDVTLVWPDDNFGYIRYFPNAVEQKRSGGSGVYYHLSYLGAPLSYLWLSTTPPALIGAEMGRAYDHGADRLWVVNVGDIKPSEVSLTYFLDLAWDVKGTRALSQSAYLQKLAGDTFGASQAEAIGDLWDGYFRLNFERRPEHLQAWLPGERPRSMNWTPAQFADRNTRFARLSEGVKAIRSVIDPAQADAFFELVDYPVRGTALANQRFAALEAYRRTYEADPATGMGYAATARAADAELKGLTQTYNHTIAGGKWRGVMAEEPADALWTSYRLSAPILPAEGLAQAKPETSATESKSVSYAQSTGSKGWRRIEGMGRAGVVYQAEKAGAPLPYLLPVDRAGAQCLRISLIPLFPTSGAGEWRFSIAVDGGAPTALSIGRQLDKTWSQGVLDNRVSLAMPLSLTPGRHTIQLKPDEAGLMIEGIELVPTEKGPCG